MWGRRILLVLIVLGCVPVVGMVYLQSQHGRTSLANFIQAQVQATLLQGRFTIGEVSVGPSGLISATDLRLTDDNEEILSAARIDTDIGVWAILGGTVQLDYLTLDDLSVRAKQNKGGLNLAAVWNPGNPNEQPGEMPQVIVENIEIRNSRISWTGPDKQTHAATSLRVAGAIRNTESQWMISDMELSGEVASLGLVCLRLNGLIGNTSLDAFDLSVSLSDQEIVKVAVTHAEYSLDNIAARITANLRAAVIRQFTKRPEFLADVDLTLNVNGNRENLLAKLDADVAGTPVALDAVIHDLQVVDLRVESNSIVPSKVWLGAPPGQLNMTLKSTMDIKNITAKTTHLTGYLDGKMFGHLGEITFNATGGGDAFVVNANVKTPFSRAQGTGIVSLEGNVRSAKADVEVWDLSALGVGAAGSVQITASANGRLGKTWRSHGTLVGSNLGYQDQRIHKIQADWKVDEQVYAKVGVQQWQFEGVTVDSVQGTLGGHPKEITFALTGSQAKERGEVQVNGTMHQDDHRVRILISELVARFRKEKLLGKDLVIVKDSKWLHIERCAIRSENSLLELEGHIFRAAPLGPKSQLQANLIVNELSKLDFLFPSAVKPKGNVKVNISHTEGKSRVVAMGHRLAAYDSQPHDLNAELNITERIAELVASTTGPAQLDLKAKFMIPQSAKAFRPQDIKELAAKLNIPNLDRFHFQTHGSFQASVQSSPIGAKMTAALDRASVAPWLEVPTSGTLSAEVFGNRTHVDVSLVGESGIRVNGDIGIGFDHLVSSPNVDATIAFGPLQIAPYTKALEPRIKLSGLLQGSGEIHGELRKPTGSLKARMTDGSLNGTGLPLVVLSGNWDGSDAKAKVQIEQLSGGSLQLRARRTRKKVRMEVLANRFELTPLSNVLPPNIPGFGGQLNGELALSHDNASSVSGSLQVSEFQLVAPGVQLSGGEMELAVEDGRWTFVGNATQSKGTASWDFAGTSESGRHNWSGELQTMSLPVLVGTTLAKLSVVAKQEGVLSQAGAELSVSLHSGNIELPKGKSQNLHSTASLDDLVWKQTAPEPSSEFPMSITLKTEDSIRVKGRQIQSSLDIDSRTQSRSAGLSVVGEARAKDGELELGGRPWRVEKAALSFGGEVPLRPIVDVVLEHDFRTLVVILKVFGPAHRPTLELTSIPAKYSEEELLAFVLGATPDDNATSNLENQAGALALGFVFGALQSELEDKLFIDKIALSSGDQGETRVQVGKWVTRKLFVGYERNFGADEFGNISEAFFQYRFIPGWVFESRYGDRGNGSADILWLKRF